MKRTKSSYFNLISKDARTRRIGFLKDWVGKEAVNKDNQLTVENNKTAFLKDPTQYLAQFNGYCAYGMSEGEATIQPQTFTIVDNKLYLNYNLKV